MQSDYYKAHLVEVYDTDTGVVYAVIKWRNKTLTIVYSKDPRLCEKCNTEDGSAA